MRFLRVSMSAMTLVVAATAVTACTADESLAPSPATSASGEKGADAGGQILSLTGAAPVRREWSAEVRAGAEGYAQGVLALGADGSVLVSASVPLEEEASSRTGVGILPVTSDPDDPPKVTWVVTPPAKARRGPEAWEGDLTDEWAVWGEGSSTGIQFLDSTFYAVRRHSREVHRVTEAQPASPDGKPVTPPGYRRPTVVGDRLVWADARPLTEAERAADGKKLLGVSLFSHPLTGGGATVEEVRGAFFPSRDECAPAPARSLVYARTRVSDATMPERTVQVWSESDGRPAVKVWHGSLPDGAVMAEAVACGGALAVAGAIRPDPAVADDLGGGVLLVVEEDGSSWKVKLGGGGQFSHVVMNRDMVGFVVDQGQFAKTYVVSRASRRVQLVQSDLGGCADLRLRGQVLLWGTAPRKGSQVCGARTGRLSP